MLLRQGTPGEDPMRTRFLPRRPARYDGYNIDYYRRRERAALQQLLQFRRTATILLLLAGAFH
jgi:hypothetical protein